MVLLFKHAIGLCLPYVLVGCDLIYLWAQLNSSFCIHSYIISEQRKARQQNLQQ